MFDNTRGSSVKTAAAVSSQDVSNAKKSISYSLRPEGDSLSQSSNVPRGTPW